MASIKKITALTIASYNLKKNRLLAAMVLVIVFLICLACIPIQAGAATSLPVLVVKSFKADPSPAQPGQVFNLEIVLANEGKKDAENISLTIGDATLNSEEAKTENSGMTFLPVESGNVLYIDKIKKGEEKSIQLKLASKSDTAPGFYDIALSLKYYHSRTPYESTAKIGLTLEQKEALVLKGLTYPQTIKLGEQATITGDIVNISNASIKAVAADYTGEGLEKQSEFFGVYEPNDSDTIENTFTPTKAGKADIGITVSYYDSFGKKQEVKSTVTIDVEEEKSAEPGKTASGSGFLDFIKFILGLGGQK